MSVLALGDAGERADVAWHLVAHQHSTCKHSTSAAPAAPSGVSGTSAPAADIDDDAHVDYNARHDEHCYLVYDDIVALVGDVQRALAPIGECCVAHLCTCRVYVCVCD
jgi:hypothetical protein